MTESLSDGPNGSSAPELPGKAREVDDGVESILLPVGHPDGNRIETLADAAAEVAGLMQTTVHVLHVFATPRFERLVEESGHDPDTPPDPDEVARRVEPVRRLTEQLAGPLRNWGMRMTVEGRVGDTVSGEIVAAADEIDAKRILVGGRQRTPTGKAVYGSTAQEVLLAAPCPVTFLRDP